MKLSLSHLKNPALGWDVSLTVESDKPIEFYSLKVNGQSVIARQASENTYSLSDSVTQKGVYPGDNHAEAVVTDTEGNEFRAEERWQ